MADLSKIPLSRIQDFSDIIDNKQNKLVAGTNITIDNTNPDSPVISSTGGGGGRSIGEVFYSQSSLAEDNSGALPLFTGETIASANTIYPEFYNWLIEHPELLIDIETYNQNISNFGESAKYIIGTQVEGNTVISYNLTKLNVTTLDKYHFGIFDSHNRFQEYFTDGSDVIAYCLYQDESNTGKQLLYVDKELTNRLYIKRINSDTSSKTGAAYIQKINYAGTLYRMLRFSTSEDVFYDNNTPSNIPFEQYNSYILPNGSLRLPLLKNYIKCANETDGITQKKAGLPNITGYTGLGESENLQDGAFGKRTESKRYTYGTGYSASANAIYLDASRSSSVYGQSDTVTPAHTTLYPWVCAYNAAVPASTAQAAEFQQGLSGKADTNFGNIPSNYDYVVESQVNADGSWYRKYKSGWLEQGGLVTVSGTVGATVTLLKPFENTAYNIQLTLQTTNAVGYIADTAQSISIANSKTTTSFGVQTAGIRNYQINGISWRAEGQGA